MYKFHLILLLFADLSFASTLIIGGEIDKTENKNGVIQLFYNGSPGCTATKISHDLIITAAHCLVGKKIENFGFSNLTYNPKGTYSPLTVINLYISLAYVLFSSEELTQFESVSSKPDIAVIRILPTPEFNYLASVKLNFDFIKENHSVQFWGYGCQTNLRDFSQDMVSLRKKASTITLGMDSLNEDHGDSSYIYKGHATKIYNQNIITPGKQRNSMASSLCYGDSGGPLLHNGKLVGINSNFTFLSIDPSKETSFISYLNLHSRISTAKAWLNSILRN